MNKFILLIASFAIVFVLTLNGHSQPTQLKVVCPNQSALFATVTVDRFGGILTTPCAGNNIVLGNQITGVSIDMDANQVFTFGVSNWVGVTAWALNRALTPIGTTGNVTINRMAGIVNIAAATQTATVTNNTVDANSFIFTNTRTNDSTCAVKNVVPTSGAFTVNMTANCTASTSIGFMVAN